MSPIMIAFFFGLGTAGFAYTKLVRANGNPSPSQDLGGAAVAGLVAFVFIFTLLKYVLNFK
jgi:hypothetical protein